MVRPKFLVVVCLFVVAAGSVTIGQLIDRTMAPNTSGDGIALSLTEQIGPGRGDWFTEDGPGRWRVDLWRANAEQLAGAGLALDAIHQARFCTAHHPDVCHSYRRDGAQAGRMVAGIRLRT